MDVVRVFDEIKQWNNELNAHQLEILNKLMGAANTSHFADIPVEEILRIQEHMFLAISDAERQVGIYDILRYLKPVVSDTDFI